MEITELTHVTDEVVQAFEHLVPQLSSSAKIPTREEIEDMVQSKSSIVLVARDPDHGGRIIGSLTGWFSHPPAKCLIEDVVDIPTAAGGSARP